MAGDRFSDLLAAKPMVKGGKNVVRTMADQTGKLWKSTMGAQIEPLVPDPVSFAAQTLMIAQQRMPAFDGSGNMIGSLVDRVTGSDLEDANFRSSAGFGFVNPSAQSTAWSGGIYTLNNSIIALNAGLPLITHPRGEPWFIRVRARYPGTQLSGSGTSPIIIVNAANTHGVEFLNNGSTTQMSIFLFDAAGNSGFLSLGADGVLGGDLFPNNAWCTQTLYFKPGLGVCWEFNDVPNPANVLTQAQMDHLFDEPAVVLAGSLDPMQITIDAIACAYHSAI